jgi:toxin ParE1/3/4
MTNSVIGYYWRNFGTIFGGSKLTKEICKILVIRRPISSETGNIYYGRPVEQRTRPHRRPDGSTTAVTLIEDNLLIRWSPEAERDLFDIWDYIWSAASTAVADKRLREIHHIGWLVSRSPELGKARDDVRAGLRSIAVDRYVVFDRVTKTAIEIVRVLDERRDVDSIFDA